MLRRLVLIGDVHTEATRLGHVLRHAAAEQVDAVLCVGDIVDGPEDAGRCIELLRDHGVRTVRGNHDRWLVSGSPMQPFTGPAWALQWLDALPPTREMDTVAGRLMLGHGIAGSDMARLRPRDTDYDLYYQDALWDLYARRDIALYVGGHIHERMMRRFDHLLILNPGTLARDDQPGFLEVDLQEGVGRWFKVGMDGVAADGEVDLGSVPCEPGRAVAP
jgi:predicted phosphodiesterase